MISSSVRRHCFHHRGQNRVASTVCILMNWLWSSASYRYVPEGGGCQKALPRKGARRARNNSFPCSPCFLPWHRNLSLFYAGFNNWIWNVTGRDSSIEWQSLEKRILFGIDCILLWMEAICGMSRTKAGLEVAVWLLFFATDKRWPAC